MASHSVKDLVKDSKRARFLCFRDGALWYETQDGFEFPIPVEDCKGAVFPREEKAIRFMRWIRKHLDLLDSEDA